MITLSLVACWTTCVTVRVSPVIRDSALRSVAWNLETTHVLTTTRYSRSCLKNGGEPTASKNYKKVLKALPENVKIVRMNTNGSRMISEIEDVLKRNIMVIVTMSLDGIGKVHDYTRWPIKWDNYKKTVDAYQELQKKYKLLQLDFWTTVSCLNIKNLPDIINFAKNKNTDIFKHTKRGTLEDFL